jgi:hypothetical protein
MSETATTAGEPHCNHDAAAVTNGICECGWIVGPCTECGSTEVATEINMEAVCADCAEELQADGDGIALDLIAALLAADQWDADTLDGIDAIVRGTGRNREDGQS